MLRITSRSAARPAARLPPRRPRVLAAALDRSAMSWIYGATGEMGFWNEQIKAERRIKKTWEASYGESLGPAREREAAEKAEAEAREAAHEERIAKATARPKLRKVAPTWKTKCGPTGMTRTWVPTTAKKPPVEPLE